MKKNQKEPSYKLHSMEHSLRNALKAQYKAGFRMFEETLDHCSEKLWHTQQEHCNPFWRIAYHTLYFTSLYIEAKEEDHKPWEFHRHEIMYFETQNIGPVYSKDQISSYLRICEKRVYEALDEIDLFQSESGFSWKKRSTLEHKLENLRHLQHHTAQMASLLRLESEHNTEWRGGSTNLE